jgi:hypothetical protein
MENKFLKVQENIDFNSINEIRVKTRKANFNRVGISILVGISVIVAIIIGLWSEVFWLNPIRVIAGTFLIGAVCASLLSYVLTRKLNQNFKKAVKEQVTQKAIEALGYDLNCFVNTDLSKAEFQKSKLIDLAYCRFKSEDFFTGKIDQLPYQFSEISIEPNYQGKLPYKGFYLSFDFSINKELIIDAVEPRTGLLNKINSTSDFRSNTVPFECLDLNNFYSIYTNEIESAMSLFSSDFISSLKQLNKTKEQTVYFTIRGGKLHIAICDESNNFNFSDDVEIENQIEQHCAELTFVHDLAKDLKLIFEPFIHKLINLKFSEFIKTPLRQENESSKSRVGLVSFIVGIISIVLCGLPIINFVLGIVALILGFVGQKDKNGKIASNKGFGIAGIVLGIISTLLGIFLTLVALVNLLDK